MFGLPAGRDIESMQAIRSVEETVWRRGSSVLSRRTQPLAVGNPKPSIVKAIARAHGWYEKEDQGKAFNIRSLAHQAGLTLMAPPAAVGPVRAPKSTKLKVLKKATLGQMVTRSRYLKGQLRIVSTSLE